MRTLCITVTGLVQGIGYRPFVAELAEELGISGEVKNAGGIVTITAAGNEEALESFVQRLSSSAPRGALVNEVQVKELPASDTLAMHTFQIAKSAHLQDEQRLLQPDLPVCEDCVREMNDPKNRRYRYPFISCVCCGPRFSIQQSVPYDRDTITMADFIMCGACKTEYRRRGDRRRHAQTIACHACGPYVKALERSGDSVGIVLTGEREDALQRAIAILRGGGIAAIKDIGGFHFAFLPDCSRAAARLREFKSRERKPFAVMFSDVEQVREYCQVNGEEEALLTGDPRPIVLLEKRKEFAPEVCAGSDRTGAMLPCNPLQILLLQELGPLVMTSGNRGGEPIVTRDGDMCSLMEHGCPDLILTHDREILTPLEDSVCQVTSVGVTVLRRGRGYVPKPIFLPRRLREECFAAGGDLKAVFALGKGNAAYLSSHFGDLEDYRCLAARNASAAHMADILNVKPSCTAADLHPLYHSGRQELFGETAVKVQHHHAHILSVMAEHALEGPVIGVAFDGTGYGTDGSIWGGEFLLCEKNRMERAGHLSAVPMIGGDAVSRDGSRSLWCFLLEAKKRGILSEEALARAKKLPCFSDKSNMCDLLDTLFTKEINTYACSSAGRLFDAVSALLGICDYNSYEGECAILLEQEAKKAIGNMEGEGCSLPKMSILSDGGALVADTVQFVAEMFLALENGADISALALYFHRQLAETVRELCVRLRNQHAVETVALSGGTFCNRILLDEIVKSLRDDGFHVYRNEAVPCGDGGLALGQLYYMTFERE